MREQEEGRLAISGQVTKVELQPKRRGRYNIYINDEYAFSVYEDTLIKHSLFKGQNVEADQVAHIMREDDTHRGYHTAVRSLSNRLKSEQELRRLLAGKGFDTDVVQTVVGRLKEQGYIDDEQFATMLTRQRIVSQKKGRLFIRQELMHKGVHKQHAEEAIRSIDEDVEFEQALGLAVKRWARTEKTREDKYKVGSFLQRRGYPGSIVSRVLKQLDRTSDEADLEDDSYD